MWNKHAVEVGLSGYQIVSCDAAYDEQSVELQNVVLQNGYTIRFLDWYNIFGYQGNITVDYGPKNAKEYVAYGHMAFSRSEHAVYLVLDSFIFFVHICDEF